MKYACLICYPHLIGFCLGQFPSYILSQWYLYIPLPICFRWICGPIESCTLTHTHQSAVLYCTSYFGRRCCSASSYNLILALTLILTYTLPRTRTLPDPNLDIISKAICLRRPPFPKNWMPSLSHLVSPPPPLMIAFLTCLA